MVLELDFLSWPLILFLVLIFIDHFDFTKTDTTKKIIIRKINKKEGIEMTHEVIKKYIGKICEVHTLDQYVEGKITTVDDKWMEVEVEEKKSKSLELVNLDFVEKISVKV
ncbi:hypothetical protein RH915_02850 [Serpentinicella sp. ANB-PHB4]|uniref:hypothetical protein n=1 Tax=Serpentinicella sp. ANB-PHB4 TaxID=3074076 RepID=UPI00285D8055|nr:hypothetical protein [Serpentinicella sp. ANB-PHB4]MDR5658420.1 hypothetical protein [Serpentinicella sp. ANB-PHB4]